jgi:ribosome-binding protein aMBF1 (putative translation factor)
MKTAKPRRPIFRLTAKQKQQLSTERERLAKEFPELSGRQEASHQQIKGKMFSQVLRTAIRGSKMALPDLAARAEIELGVLVGFLSGETTLSSDAVDRLGKLLKLTLQLPKRWPIEEIRIRRIYMTLTPSQRLALQRERMLIEQELPELIRRNQLAHDAREEKTISGALRRAIQSCRIMLDELARRAEVDSSDIADFLCGEKPLASDAMDRLAEVLKLKLTASKPNPRRAKAS